MSTTAKLGAFMLAALVIVGFLVIRIERISLGGKQAQQVRAAFPQVAGLDEKAPVRVANMTLELKKADTKRNKYNLNVVADDKRVEKKDKTINEPVQLYVGGARQPYEIVVNEVKKDTITGYIAVPKVLRAAR